MPAALRISFSTDKADRQIYPRQALSVNDTPRARSNDFGLVRPITIREIDKHLMGLKVCER